MRTETEMEATSALSSGNGKRQRLARWFHASGVLPGLQRVRGLLRRDLRILAYHRVLDLPDPDRFAFDLALVSASSAQFRRQMDLVRRRFNPVRFADVVAALDGGPPLPRDPVIVTFDDGYDDNYHVAFPILHELGVPATFFVSTGHIDSGQPYAYDWLVHMICTTPETRIVLPQLGIDQALPAALTGRRDVAEALLDQLKTLDDDTQDALIAGVQAAWGIPRVPHPDCRPMNWDQLRRMQAEGMEIGSHGVGHRMLAKLPAAAMEHEIAASKQALDHHLARPVDVISYPVGGPDAYDEAVVAAVERSGYRIACSYVAGTNPLAAPARHALRRLPVEREMDAPWFSAMVTWPEVFGYPSRLRPG